MKCPICKKETGSDSQFAPFCSDRCRLLDLAAWSDGKYVISSPLVASEEDDKVKADPLDDED